MAQTRRTFIRTNLGAAGTAIATGLPLSTAHAANTGHVVNTDPGSTIKLALSMGINPSQWKIARQIGVTHAIAGANGALNAAGSRDRYEEALAALKRQYEEGGLTIVGVESDPVSSEKIKLGIEGREEEMANYIAAIKAMGAVGIPMCCWNFMAGIGWLRTRFDIPERGGALTSEFNYEDAEREGPTEWGKVSEKTMWDNITWFLKRIIPVAEKAGVKMALHPDDPPISPLRGISRIVISADAYRRIMDIVPSPVNGVAFCQANFLAMGEDIEAVAREFCAQKKIFFVHFRDIEGKGRHFRETFHDNGPTDMVRMMRVYHEAGFAGPMRPDHAPTIEGEDPDSRGYGMLGKILAIGYMIGIMDTLDIPFA